MWIFRHDPNVVRDILKGAGIKVLGFSEGDESVDSALLLEHGIEVQFAEGGTCLIVNQWVEAEQAVYSSDERIGPNAVGDILNDIKQMQGAR